MIATSPHLHLLVALFLCTLSRADDLQPLGDEFNDASTLSRYKENTAAEGWVASITETADVNTTTPGHFRLVPRTCGWYEHLRGTHFSKQVTGNFIATTRLLVYSRDAGGTLLNTPANRLFSLAGILIREPRAITHAAPSPYTLNAVWPPQSFGSDWTPGDETWANTGEAGRGENYIFLSYGTAGNANTRQFEIKATRRSRSELYYAATGVNQSVNEVWLQIVRVGSTVVCLRRHSASGPWYVENRYPNPDHAFPQFGATLDVGITAYTDWDSAAAYEAAGPQGQFHFNYSGINGQPDLITDVDYLRLQRPDPALTETVLQGMSVSYNPASNSTANPPVQLTALANTAAAPYLGDNANTPLGNIALSTTAISVNETAGTATVTVTRSGSSTGLPLSLHYTTANGTAAAGTDFTATSGTLSWTANDTASKHILIPLVSGDGLAEGDETFTVTLSQLDGPATFPSSSPDQTATVTLQDSPLDAWRFAEFGPQANDPAAQPAADFDLDGLANILEFIFNTVPDAANPSPISITRPTATSLQVTYPLNLSATNITVIVESSALLTSASWSDADTTYEPVGSPVNQVQIMRATVPVPPGDSARFIRIAATK